LPAAGLSRRRFQLSGELARTRETQAIYLTQRDAEVYCEELRYSREDLDNLRVLGVI
jgi:hypothetical protein